MNSFIYKSYYLIFYFDIILIPSYGVDLNIFGRVAVYDAAKFDIVATRQIYSKCFFGIGFKTCLANNLKEPDAVNDLSYYQNINLLNNVDNYCLQCCGAARTTVSFFFGINLRKLLIYTMYNVY